MSDNTTPEPEPQPLSGKAMERLLLLADMSPSHASRMRQIQDDWEQGAPSASDVTINQPFTAPGPVSVKDDPEQTAAWIDKMQKEADQYWSGPKKEPGA
jgi:hypothetical protein